MVSLAWVKCDLQNHKWVLFVWKTFIKIISTAVIAHWLLNYLCIYCLMNMLPSAVPRYENYCQWILLTSTVPLRMPECQTVGDSILCVSVTDDSCLWSHDASPDTWKMHRMLLHNSWNDYEAKHSWENSVSEESSELQLN